MYRVPVSFSGRGRSGIPHTESTPWGVCAGETEPITSSYEDCCTVFTPRHPATRPDLEAVRTAEAALDVEGLVAKALAGETWVRVKVTDEPKI